MRLALAISSLFPSGGLQRDCVNIARLLKEAGSDVVIVTADHRERMNSYGVPIEVWSSSALTNPGRDLQLGNKLAAASGTRFDRIVGFNKMPGLDVYYCGDPPYSNLNRSALKRFFPKFRAQQMLERCCFGPQTNTALLVLQRSQQTAYREIWKTLPDRFRILSPTLDPARRRPELRTTTGQPALRNKLDVSVNDWLWLSIASAPAVKGVDRTIRAMSVFTDAFLSIAGVSAGSRNGRWIMRLARSWGVADRIQLLGHREDISEVMAAADLFVHPARLDTTGTVILEAVVNGLPVIASAVCGYAEHVTAADAGLVVLDPWNQSAFEAALWTARDRARCGAWSANGASYGRVARLDTGLAEAAKLMVGPLWGRTPNDGNDLRSNDVPAGCAQDTNLCTGRQAII